ncbi:P-loop-containing kinase [Candidatus Scalindua japonica]|uniref:P-loop-containing kinase n=1 Tax=Candidatus Scalindua japonica TaxID=1284222 RepID=A0A286U4B4_9BACT|nr:sulfotransferase [Candidatus Scalindua japonica]GAX62972.1 P-loop-containing kinase [Candidatus Scalindua japonica]
MKRRNKHQKNENLEIILKEINSILCPIEDKIIENYRMPEYPIVLITGCARSGSTLLLQWLAGLGYFCYPSNILSRFYGAPCIGAKIQLMLTKYDFNNEIFDFNEEVPFESVLGKTKGALAPNEFWYFWRRFFPYGEIQYLDEQSLKQVDADKFVAELAAVEAVFNKPVALKGLIINWNIPYVSSIFDKILFINVKRHPFYSIQSLLDARVKYYGNRKAWYSFKPREYEGLKDLEPCRQVAGQVFHTNCAIEKGLSQIDAKRCLNVNYEEFCMDPEKIFQQIVNKLADQGYRADWRYTGQDSFQPTNQIRLPEEEGEKVIESYKFFSGEELVL